MGDFVQPQIIADLVAELRTQFDGHNVEVHSALPRTIASNRVIVAPAEPWLIPATHGMLEERWDVLATANHSAPDRGIPTLRDMAVRIALAVHSVGGVWEQASTPMVPEEAQGPQTTVFTVSQVRFKWEPTFTIPDPDPDPEPDPDTGEPTP